MKLFKVSIDNDPGGWKSGENPSLFVPANNKEEAIQKIKNGWDNKWDFNSDGCVITYMKIKKEFPIINENSTLSASEIKFDGYDIHIKPIRKAKLDRIDKNSKRNDS